MKKVKKVKITPFSKLILKVVGIVLCLFIGIFIFYRKEISQLTDLGYSYEASKRILFSKNKDYVLSVGENKTLNEAFESPYLNEKNLDNYSKIKYVNHEHFIDNINKLLKKGYSNTDINLIVTHGTDSDVIDFIKKDKVRYLEEFLVFDYAKIRNYDRYVALSDLTGEDEEDVIIMVNLDLDRNDYEDPYTVSKFSTDMLINKHRCLTEDFEPDDLVEISSKYTAEDIKASRIAVNAFSEMYNAALKDGYDLEINSAYRSFSDQQSIVDEYQKLYGESYVEKFVAKAGFSEHQTGLAFDIGSKTSKVFAQSKEFNWMQDNAYKYGFIYRYDKRYENLTGFRNEAWHYRYVGKKIAKYIHEHNNMSLEEYFVVFLDK